MVIISNVISLLEWVGILHTLLYLIIATALLDGCCDHCLHFIGEEVEDLEQGDFPGFHELGKSHQILACSRVTTIPVGPPCPALVLLTYWARLFMVVGLSQAL